MMTTGLRVLHGAALLLVPFCIALISLLSGTQDPVAFGPQQMVLNVIEVLGIAIVAVLTYRRLSLLNAIGIAVILASARALACGAAAAGAAALEPGALSPGGAFLAVWTGRLEIAAMQVVLQILVGVPFFGAYFPRWVGELGVAMMRPEDAGSFAGASRREREASLRSPSVGAEGTLSFTSYEEMDAVIARTRDLVGYALANTEGLIVLSDGRRLPFPMMATVPRLQAALATFQAQQQRCGVAASDVWQFSSEYTTVLCAVKPCFALILFFPPTSPHADLAPRVGTIRRSVEAYLADRHRLLKEKTRVAA